MRKLGAAIAAAIVLGTLPAGAQALPLKPPPAVAPVKVSNGLVEWTWSRAPFRTQSIRDLRAGGRTWAGAGPDFTVVVAGVSLAADTFRLDRARVDHDPNGRTRATFTLQHPGMVVTRTVEAYPGVAGFRVSTALRATLPLLLSGVRIVEASVTSAVVPTRHAFRAGADWREPGWPGPDATVGDPHAGTWRDTSGDPNGPGQWLSLTAGARSMFFAAEANDFPSVRTAFAAGKAASLVDYTRDLLVFGPFEEQVHAENPGLPSPVGRHRVLEPGKEIALPPVFVGMGAGDGDETWQFSKYLTRFRLTPYEKAVTFNSNGVDTNRISTGAKDDMDFETVKSVAARAKELGVETFILDDGWQEPSGDWNPDPRRFPDQTFAAVRDVIAPMKLGLWMSPMHFHPTSATFRAHPEWACIPVGHALAAYNTVDPASGSNEAGIGEWSRWALPHIEAKMREAITSWGVVYFKFDFLAWLDCVGQGDLYDMHEAFMAMLDRVQGDHPHVTLEVDETNDYRLFPFESVTRGPSWFQNGSPPPSQLLHNLWNLSPWVPSWSLGQHLLGGGHHETWPVSTLVAASFLSHITFFNDIRNLPASVVAEAAPWLAFYKQWRPWLTDGVVYPLLADPLAARWTALQAWDPEAARGALLAFRQDDAAASATIRLRNVPPGRVFELRQAPDGAVVGTATSQELTAGLVVTLPKRGAQVLIISPVA